MIPKPDTSGMAPNFDPEHNLNQTMNLTRHKPWHADWLVEHEIPVGASLSHLG